MSKNNTLRSMQYITLIEAKLLVYKTFIRAYMAQAIDRQFRKANLFTSLAACNTPVNTLEVEAPSLGNCSLYSGAYK